MKLLIDSNLTSVPVPESDDEVYENTAETRLRLRESDFPSITARRGLRKWSSLCISNFYGAVVSFLMVILEAAGVANVFHKADLIGMR